MKRLGGMFKSGGFGRTVGWLQGNGMSFIAPIKSDQRCESRRVVWYTVGLD